MGEFEEETASEPIEGESAAVHQEPAEAASDLHLADEPTAEDDSIGAIQDSLLLDEPEVSAADAVPVPVPTSEPTDSLPDTENPAQSELFPAPEANDAELAAAWAAYGALDDDLAAAIAASHEQVGTDGTLDDIAPGTTHNAPAKEIISDTGVRYGAPWWPFLIYLGAWFALAAVAVWQFQQLAPGTVLYETQQYMLFVFAGLVLAASGLILILAVWLGSRVSPKRHRAGLFTSAFIKGAAFILIGIVVWWATFMALDYLRLGRLI